MQTQTDTHTCKQTHRHFTICSLIQASKSELLLITKSEIIDMNALVNNYYAFSNCLFTQYIIHIFVVWLCVCVNCVGVFTVCVLSVCVC